MRPSDDQFSGWTEKLQSTSQSQTCTQKRLWSLIDGLMSAHLWEYGRDQIALIGCRCNRRHVGIEFALADAYGRVLSWQGGLACCFAGRTILSLHGIAVVGISAGVAWRVVSLRGARKRFNGFRHWCLRTRGSYYHDLCRKIWT